MNLTKYSNRRLSKSMNNWAVPDEWKQVLYNYLVHGFEPGGFFTSLLANDALGAISRSHPANDIQSLKSLASWIVNSAPREAWGSYEKVDAWLKLPVTTRRAILEQHALVYTEREEILCALTQKS
jgi:hypothetical protein